MSDAYQGISGYSTKLAVVVDDATTYGEISPVGIQALSDKFGAISPLPKFPAGQRIFYDLGCGIGSAVLGIAILNPEIQSRGIEIVPDRVRSAQTALGKIRNGKLSQRITIRQGDILSSDYNYRDAAWIFVSNLCFTAETNALLAEKLSKECQPGCTLICSRELALTNATRIEKAAIIPMTWSSTSTCIVYKKV
jgi:hypothetical protein